MLLNFILQTYQLEASVFHFGLFSGLRWKSPKPAVFWSSICEMPSGLMRWAGPFSLTSKRTQPSILGPALHLLMVSAVLLKQPPSPAGSLRMSFFLMLIPVDE